MTMFDVQDYDELLRLVVKAEAEEMIDGILIENSPSTRMVFLKSLEIKLIGGKRFTVSREEAAAGYDHDEARMLDGRLPPAMDNTQEDEAY